MKKVMIGGVPEYFNLPILLAKEKGKFAEKGIDLVWQDIPEGTGKMAQSLAEDSLDMVIALTEGMSKSIAQGNPSKIVHTYVQSPVIWGIHTTAQSSASSLNDLKGKPFAISRFGSGSHLMAILMAKELGWNENDLNFKVVNDLEGARNALKNNHAHIFLWEKFTTKFLVDDGEFKRIGEYPTPWPGFVVSATEKMIDSDPDILKDTLETIIAEAKSLSDDPTAKGMIAERYSLLDEDVHEFWPSIQWNHEITLPDAAVQKALTTFQSLGQIDSPKKPVLHLLT